MSGILLEDALRFRAQQVWPEPDHGLLASDLPDAPPTPVLPGTLGDALVRAAEAKNCSLDYVLGATLVAGASLIGNSRWASVWPGDPDWVEATVLRGLLVGSPSTSKSPAADVVMDPLGRMERDLADGHDQIQNDHEQKKELARMKAEEWRDATWEASKKGLPVPPRPIEALEPDAPQRKRLVVSDTTIEGCTLVVAGNPKGVLVFNDEATAQFANYERRGGNDRFYWLQSYGGRPYSQDRVKNLKPIKIDHLSISILGTVQPDPFRKYVLESTDDGLSSRFLYFFPSSHPPFRRPRGRFDAGLIERIFRKLHSLEMRRRDDGRLEPVVIPFSEDAATTLRLGVWISLRGPNATKA